MTPSLNKESKAQAFNLNLYKALKFEEEVSVERLMHCHPNIPCRVVPGNRSSKWVSRSSRGYGSNVQANVQVQAEIVLSYYSVSL